ncbi:DUF4870 domain-containing protein [Amnibacterium flavum]|uniref:DUF4870 domain-containing protein n=2 Tax=Amnibacterium flavum TaxID=2173173 RepID=A0A2V1HNI2_9MICO|nr:DUF4870 domain-containing protein [Amnibacterium flavum]
MSPEDQRLWATLDHIGGIFFGWLSTLIVYLVLKDRGGFIQAHAKTALNFHLTMLIAIVVGYITTFLLIGFLILAAAYIVIIVFAIMAAIKANSGEMYSYPLTIKFIK